MKARGIKPNQTRQTPAKKFQSPTRLPSTRNPKPTNLNPQPLTSCLVTSSCCFLPTSSWISVNIYLLGCQLPGNLALRRCIFKTLDRYKLGCTNRNLGCTSGAMQSRFLMNVLVTTHDLAARSPSSQPTDLTKSSPHI